MKKILLPIITAFLFSGCASVLNDVTHPLKIETKTNDGKIVVGADCKYSNDFATGVSKSGDSIQVRRSSKDLDIVCNSTESGVATGRAISRANGGLFGNILLGGGIGAIIDHNKGTAYTYPTWIQLVFGKTLVFDRKDEKEGQSVVGTVPNESK